MPTASSLDFFFLDLKCGIRVVLKPSGVESAKQSPQGSSAGNGLKFLEMAGNCWKWLEYAIVCAV